MVYSTSIHELRSTPGYNHHIVSVNKNLSGVTSAYLKRHYSKIDAEIYINGEWVEDIFDIDWTIQQQTIPLYGYNSYIFDDVAQGSRIINGKFVINFTKPRYIEKAIAKTQTSPNEDGPSYEDKITALRKMNVGIHKNGSTYEGNPQHYCIFNNKFDIDIICGENEKLSGEPVHIILRNCVITNTYDSRGASGGVAQEIYQFIAQDITTIS